MVFERPGKWWLGRRRLRAGEQIAADLGCTAEFVETTYANAPAGLQAGQFDIMFVLDPTPARAMSIDFPFSPMLYYALGFLTREPAPARTWAELTGQKPPSRSLWAPRWTAG